MENQNQNKEQIQPIEPQEGGPETLSPEQEHLFFNVMPKNKMDGVCDLLIKKGK